MSEIFGLVARVLRDPLEVVESTSDRAALARTLPGLLAIAAGGAAVFGLVAGSYRGGEQLAFAAVKMPFLLWIPVALTLPVVRALWAACEVEVPWTRVAVAGLVAMARTAVLAAALGPALWLVYSLRPDYHFSVLLLAASLVLVGLPGLSVLARAMPVGGRRRGLAMAGSLLVLGLTTAQTGWVLRPFVARPTAEVTFLRPIEEDVFSGLGATTRSATGDYRGWEAESKGLLRQRGDR